MDNILLILSSKKIPKELQFNFGEIPSAMIPILPGKVLLDKIYNDFCTQYSKIYISIFEEEKILIEYIESKYKNKIIPIILDKIDDIGYSIKYCYRRIKRESNKEIENFTIIYGDTNLQEGLNVFEKKVDTYFYSLTKDKKRWTTFNIKNKKLIILDKNKDEDSKENEFNTFIGVFNFKNIENFIKKIKKNIEKDSFYKGLEEYYIENQINFQETLKWEDYGHLDNYNKNKKEVAPRYFNSLEIDRERGILIKTSKETKKFINEIKWYLELPNNLQYVAPRIFDYSLKEANSYIKMEYYGYPTLHEIFLFGNYEIEKWEKIFDTLFFINNDFKKYKLDLGAKEIKKALREIYYNKTVERLNALKENLFFKKYFENKLFINNQEFPSLKEIVDNLEKHIEIFNLYNIDYFNIIHGDYFFANILYDSNSNLVRIVDPRGDFGGCGIYGDNRYELAKLAHSLDGKYDFIVEDMFELKYVENKIEFKIGFGKRHEKIKEKFYKKLSNYESPILIKFIQSLLFLSMIPLHKDNLERQIVMLATGLVLYKEALGEKGEKI